MRILFVCGEYFPKASANGVCVIRLQEEFIKKKIHSDVICIGNKTFTQQTDFGELFTVIGKDNFKDTGFIRSLVNKAKLIKTWPVKDLKLIDNYAAAINKMNMQHNYNIIISVLRPIEGAIACAKFENVIIYELDSITNNGDNLYGIKHLLSYRAQNIEKKIYNNAFKIFHLRCHEDYYKNKKYDWIRDKFEYTDIPQLIVKNQYFQSVSNDITRITYTGSLTKIRNSPAYTIKLFIECIKDLKIECRFYSKGNCEKILKKANEKYGNLIIPMGYVSQKELTIAKENTDIYLSIGFHHTGTVTSIPSKIFEYMSTGKPIIHIIGGKNDTAIEYLVKYRNALIINPDDSLQRNVGKIKKFIMEAKGNIVDTNELRTNLPMNTPEWTVNKLIKSIEEMNRGV